MKKIFAFLFLLFIGSFFVILTPNVYSDELDDITKKINELRESLESSKKATTPLETQVTNLKKQLTNIENRVVFIENDIKEKRKIIEKGYKDLAVQKDLFNQTVRNYYIKHYFFSPLIIFISSNDASEITRILAYQKVDADQDKAIITTLAVKISDLEIKERDLEGEEKRLAILKTKLDVEKVELEKIVAGAKKYQASLSSEIAQLSTKQQQLLAQKLGSLNLPTSLGAGPLYCTDDRKLDPGFSGFAFFTYGIPHRVGMNQYGANGRANSGQSHEDILRAYFEGISFETRDPNLKIKVQGHGEYNLDDYVARIYEMPNSFHIEALKAQAVAARSYALSYTNNGEKEICTTQSCQVFKPEAKGGAWEQAVHDTSGKVMTNGGQVITAWYASTAGGYVYKSSDVGWSDRPWTKRMRDTNGDVSSFQDLADKAYDKESPCFYAAQGFRSEYAKSAWLKPSEVADIINVLLLAKADSSTQTHLSQVDKPNPDGAETYDHERVKQELRSRNITPYNSIISVSIDWDSGLGRTNTISFQGDAGSNSFSSDEFKNYFNLRAPANIQIVGPLYNVEKR